MDFYLLTNHLGFALNKKKLTLDGPPSYANWLAYVNKQPLLGISEYPFYTDANITGEITENFGPYKF